LPGLKHCHELLSGSRIDEGDDYSAVWLYDNLEVKQQYSIGTGLEHNTIDSDHTVFIHDIVDKNTLEQELDRGNRGGSFQPGGAPDGQGEGDGIAGGSAKREDGWQPCQRGVDEAGIELNGFPSQCASLLRRIVYYLFFIVIIGASRHYQRGCNYQDGDETIHPPAKAPLLHVTFPPVCSQLLLRRYRPTSSTHLLTTVSAS
jgi:hypothetical protein